MRIVAISDTHNYHNKIQVTPCDILIHCGDMSGTGQEWEIRSFAKWLNKQPAKHKICTVGNHEREFEKQLPLSKTWFYEECPDVHLLLHEYIEIEGLKIFGSPYTPTFFNWAFMKNRGPEIAYQWKDIPNDLDILMCHGMPMDILDTVHDWHTGDEMGVGCEDLLDAIRLTRPKIFLGGHLHMKGGTSVKKYGTIFYNCAVCNDDYKPVQPLTVIDL